MLEMIDKKKLGIVQGVNISFLTEEQQNWVIEVLQENQGQISNDQSERLKIGSKTGRLTFSMVKQILTNKEGGKSRITEPKVTIKSNIIAQYFPPSYTTDEIEQIIIELLGDWKKRCGK